MALVTPNFRLARPLNWVCVTQLDLFLLEENMYLNWVPKMEDDEDEEEEEQVASSSITNENELVDYCEEILFVNIIFFF